MAADDRESGQSIVEFLIMLPIIVGLIVVLVRINTVIQVSIVNQQYARARALDMAYNNPYYPSAKMQTVGKMNEGYHQVVIGMTNKLIEDAGETPPPEPTRVAIIRKAKGAPKKNDDVEPDQTPVVPVRTTVTLCAPSRALVSKGKPVPIAAKNMGPGFDPKLFAYCRSPLNE